MLPIGISIAFGVLIFLVFGGLVVAIKGGVYGDNDPALFGGTAVAWVAMFTLMLLVVFYSQPL